MDIITFGSGIWDIFLEWETSFLLKIDRNNNHKKEICFPLGSKLNTDNIYFSLGGGGINTALTFANQGFDVAFCGMIGKDLQGEEILKELKKNRINQDMVFQTEKAKTDHSTILLIKDQDRTILTYRGASQLLKISDIDFKTIKKTKWIYLAPLSKQLFSLFVPLVDFAFDNNIKVAVNPGMDQLKLSKELLRKTLKKIDVLILNKEEAAILTNRNYQNEEEILNELKTLNNKIKIMTKGSEGLIVLDDKNIYSAAVLNDRVIETTGAGDAFASGFLSVYIKNNNDIEKAIQFGSANATACLKKYGAQEGLLKMNEKYENIKILKHEI